MAAVLEYITSEILELAGDSAGEKHRITPRHLQLSIKQDDELSQLFSHITISQGGVLSNINSSLFPAKKGSKEEAK